MPTYKIFKKNPSRLKMLIPLSPTNKLKVGKLINCDNAFIGYNEDCEMFLEMAQCPRIYIGIIMECRNVENNDIETLGKLVDLQYDESNGYLFIFE